MRKFRKIENRPLKNFSDLNLNVVKIVEVGTVERNTEVDKHLNKLFDYVKKNPDITMVGVEKEGEVYLSGQIKSSANKKIYTFPEPNPVCIYYNIANENLEKSNDLKNKINSKKQDYNAIEDFELFTEYYSLTSQGIIFLITTVEGFLNQFFKKENYEIDGEIKSKKCLEYSKVEEKLQSIIPSILNINFSVSHSIEYQTIIETNNLRNELIHLKQIEGANNTSYQELFKKLIDYDQFKNSEAVFTLLERLKPDYFKIKE